MQGKITFRMRASTSAQSNQRATSFDMLCLYPSRRDYNFVFRIVSPVYFQNVSYLAQGSQDLRIIYRRGYEFSNSSLFARMHCTLPECIAPLFTRLHCATNNILFRVDSSEKG